MVTRNDPVIDYSPIARSFPSPTWTGRFYLRRKTGSKSSILFFEDSKGGLKGKRNAWINRLQSTSLPLAGRSIGPSPPAAASSLLPLGGRNKLITSPGTENWRSSSRWLLLCSPPSPFVQYRATHPLFPGPAWPRKHPLSVIGTLETPGTTRSWVLGRVHGGGSPRFQDLKKTLREEEPLIKCSLTLG